MSGVAGFLGGAVAGVGMSLWGRHQERKAYKKQAAVIRRQMALNRDIADFNKSVLEKTYPEVRANIKMELRKVVASQMSALSINGFAPGAASPYFILGETTRMGEKSLQQAAFNHQVDMKNEEFRAKGIENSLNSDLINAKYRARAAGFKMFSTAFGSAIRGYSIYSLAKDTGNLDRLNAGLGFGLGTGVY